MKDRALLMTAADNLFWTFEQAVSYYQFALIHYIGFMDKGMLLVGVCRDSNGNPQIDKTDWLDKAYQFGKSIYGEPAMFKVKTPAGVTLLLLLTFIFKTIS